MNPEEYSFENFMSLDHSLRRKILNDPKLLKIMVEKNLKPGRFQHSLNVADVCEKLARIHGVDPKKAYIAGLLHDVCKFPDEEEIKICTEILRYYEPEKLKSVPGAYHSWAAKYYLRENCCFHDSDILNAIYNHTICNSRDRLSLILYIADKREPSRKIDDDILQIAERDLLKAYRKLNQSVERYIREVKNERFIEDRI